MVEVIFCIRLLLHHKTFKIKKHGCSLSYPLALYCEKQPKIDHLYEEEKVGRSNAIPTKLFSVDSYDLNIKSLKFGNDIFITFEMPGSSYKMPFWKSIIPLLFRLFAPEVLVLAKYPPPHDYRTPHTWF